MTDITTFWQQTQNNQARIQRELDQEEQANQPGQIPTRTSLVQVFESEMELAVCASSLFVLIVQDQEELGGGYLACVIGLFTELAIHHIETIEQMEEHLAKVAPYQPNSPVWVPLPQYNSKVLETEYLKRLAKKGEDVGQNT